MHHYIDNEGYRQKGGVMCHCQGSSCCCGNQGKCEAKSKCCCSPADEQKRFTDESCSNQLMELADQAWMEVLKDKIKEHIHANAKHMDDLARLISEANHERWKKKMDAKCACSSFDEKLNNFFKQTCNGSK